MVLTDYSGSLKGRLNAPSPGELPTLLQALGFGDLLRACRSYRRGVAAAAALNNPYVAAAAQSITLPEGAKASQLERIVARAGGGTVGPLAVVAEANGAPTAGNCAVSPSGDLVFLAADAWTLLDFEYSPEKADVIELNAFAVVPATGVLAIPAVYTAKGVLRLIEAEALTGTTVGKKIIQIPAAAAPATTLAGLNLAKTQVFFAIADAVTTARVKFLVSAALDVNALLEGASPTI